MNNEFEIPYPRLLHPASTYPRYPTFVRNIYPVQVSIDLNIIPLSTATVMIPHGETIPARDYVELFTSRVTADNPTGSVGIFRARNPQDTYEGYTSDVELESALVEIGDYLVKTKYEAMMSAPDAITALMSHYTGTYWTLDLNSLSVFEGERLIGLTCDYQNILEALLSVMEQLPAYYITMDYSGLPWKLGFAKRDTVVSAEGRLSRNIESLTIDHDDTDICTRAYYRVGETTAYMDADAYYQNKNGVVERMVAQGDVEAEVLLQVTDYLNKHRDPKVTIEISADDLSNVTHENLDTFTIGKMMKLEILDYRVDVSRNITQLSWDDVYGAPRRVTVTLEEEPDAQFNFVHTEEQSE